MVKIFRFLLRLFYFTLLLSLINCSRDNFSVNKTDDSKPVVTDTTLENNVISGKIFTDEVYPTYFISKALITLANDSLQFQTSSDDFGTYVIENIPTGNFKLNVISAEYDTAEIDLSFTGADTLDMDFNLHIIYDFAPGTVLMGILDSTSFNQVFIYSDSIGFPILRMNGFTYRTDLVPIDSANKILDILNHKSYLNKEPSHPVLSANEGKATVTVYNFFNMGKGEFLDWLSTRENLGIHFINMRSKDIEISVPIDEELFWLRQFKKYKIVRWLTLDYHIPGGW